MSFAETGASSMSRPLLEDSGPLPVLLSTVICSKRLRLHVARTFGTQLCTHKPPTSKPNTDLIGSLLWYLLFVIEQRPVVPLQADIHTSETVSCPPHTSNLPSQSASIFISSLFSVRYMNATGFSIPSRYLWDKTTPIPYSEASQAKRISTFGSK